MKLSPFFRSSVALGSSTVGRLAIGLVKTKMAALFLGAQGVGIIGLMSQLELLGMSLCSLSIGNGLAKRVSHSRSSGDSRGRAADLATATGLLLALGGITLVVGGGAIAVEAMYFPEGELRWQYLLPVLVAVPLHAFIGSFVMGVYFGHERIKEYSQCSIFGAVVELVLFLTTVSWLGVAGALWAATAGFAAWLGSALWLMRRFETAPRFSLSGINKTIARDLLKTGLVMSATGGLTYLTNSLVRAYFLSSLGTHEAGIYHVSIVFSSLYMPLLTNGIWARLHPKVSAEGCSEAALHEWAEALAFIALFGTLAQAGITAFSDLAILTLYTREFLDASSLIPYQMAGDFFFLLAQPAMAVLLARAQLRRYLFSWLLYYVSLGGLTLGLAGAYGLRAAPIAYFVASLILALSGTALFARETRGNRLRARRLGMAITAAGCLLALELYLRLEGFSLWARAVPVILWAAVSVPGYFKPELRRWIVV